MTIKSSAYFNFNGVFSKDYGILNVNLSGGMQSELLASNRSITERKVRGNSRPYFQELQVEPYELTLSFAFEDSWDNIKLREITRWLTTPKYYAPLFFQEDEDRIFYCLCVDAPELIHNSLSQGYINIRFRCMDAYSYSRVYTEIIDLSSNPSAGTAYVFKNLGDANVNPFIEIYKIGTGDVNFINQSDGNAEMTLTGLSNLETVKVDCDNRIIQTNLPFTYRYDNLIGEYLSLPIHYNYMLIKGTCQVKISYQFKRLQ